MYWTVHLEGGPRRVNHAAVAVGGRIFSFGGYCTGENYRRKRPMDVHVLNTGKDVRFSSVTVSLGVNKVIYFNIAMLQPG